MTFAKKFSFVFGFSFLIFLYSVFCFVNIPVASAQSAADVEAQRARLQAELEAEERAIAAQTILLEAKQRDTATVAGEVDLLKSQIARAQANIKAKRVAITRLEDDILARQSTIETLTAKIKRQQASLAELLRQVRDTEELSFVEVMLDNRQVTEIFSDVDAASSIQEALSKSFSEMRESQEEARREQAALEEKKYAEIDARKVIEAEAKVIEKKEAEKRTLLAINKNQEQAYQKVLAERQRRAAQIRAALFALRDTAAIPFGEALEYATIAYKQTGVRPAFILAILTQESNLGEHQGSCLLSDIKTGDGIGKNTGTVFQQVMKAPRDTDPFKNITDRLGLDWRTTPVSCPPEARYYVGRGFGGGMGPSQFIPSTWELFKSKLGALLNLPANSVSPWNPEHAFMATAIYLKDLGAGTQAYSAERNAACRYYSGAACKPGRKPANVFYGDQVMAKAQDIQANMIDPLQNI